METLVLDGKSYVKASKAAKELGYATDYVGQLCRGGKVDAHLIGRTWYVNQEELGTHKTEKKRMSRMKAREYAKRSIAEHKKEKGETQNHYRNVVIHYERDDGTLIPDPKKKLHVHSEKPHFALKNKDPKNQGDEMAVINEGEKVSMRGALKVVDVTDGPVDDETIFLHPSDIQVSHMEESDIGESIHDDAEDEVEEAPAEIIVQKQKTFIEKLAESDVQLMNTEVEDPEGSVSEVKAATLAPQGTKAPISLTTCVIIAVLVYGLSFVSIATKQIITYTPTNNDTISENISFKISFTETFKIISSKI